MINSKKGCFMHYQNIIEQYIKDGAHLDKFDVFLEFGSSIIEGLTNTRELSVMCKTAAFPERTVDQETFTFRGKDIRLPKYSKFDGSWSCTFYCDQSHRIRNMFLWWMDKIDTRAPAKVFTEGESRLEMESLVPDTVIIKQYPMKTIIDPSNTDGESASYVLYGVFPTNISQMEVSSEQGGLMEFTVTFAYTYFETLTTNVSELLNSGSSSSSEVC